MSHSYDTELLAEAAGVKIVKTSIASTNKIILQFDDTSELSTKNDKSSCGFHLTKSKWDPYPWVGSVEHESIADRAGLRPGDCLLDVDGTNVLGLKMKDVGALINERENRKNVNLRIWRYEPNSLEDEETGIALRGPLPEVATKLANALSGTIRCLECPVCLENATPPVSQCVHGHILCVDCRPKTSRCPVCRVRLGQGRCLIAEKIQKVIRDIFRTNHEVENDNRSTNRNLIERLFGGRYKPNVMKINPKNINVLPKSRRSLLTKLFLGGLEKAASTENLTTVSKEHCDGISMFRSKKAYCDINLEKLNLNDRPKSASTGELSVEKVNHQINISHCKSDLESINITRSMTLNLSSHEATWDDSTDSIYNINLSCPLFKKKKCEEILTLDMLFEHLRIRHNGPLIHFNGGRIKLPIPFPFEADAICILHYADDIFFFQVETDSLWMMNILGKNKDLEWTLHAWGNTGTEIRCRRFIANLEHPTILSSKNIVLLPKTLGIHTIDIQIIDFEMIDKSEI
ncbi:putative E3 ubiquitin-protein ligase sinah [Vespula squamosa]|uniref:E3 ubiquitin-protein ligase sinah n=1 Tax=Vespula squamosa TaxID=30214 RepID=A0ABD2AC80_VESSQ